MLSCQSSIPVDNPVNSNLKPMTERIRTLCLITTPHMILKSRSNSAVFRQKKALHPKRQQKVWAISANDPKAKVVCMSRRSVHKASVQGNFKKDKDIIKLAPLVFEQPLLASFNALVRCDKIESVHLRTVYDKCLKVPLEGLLQGKFSKVVVFGFQDQRDPSVCEEMVQNSIRHLTSLLKLQKNSPYLVGISAEWTVRGDKCLDLLVQEAIPKFETLNGKHSSVIHVKNYQQFSSIMHLCRKNQERLSLSQTNKLRGQTTIVYMIELNQAQHSFSKVTFQRPLGPRTTKDSQVSALIQQLSQAPNRVGNDHEEIFRKSLNTTDTRNPPHQFISLIYLLANDRTHIQHNLATFALAQEINSQIYKRTNLGSSSAFRRTSILGQIHTTTQRVKSKSRSDSKAMDTDRPNCEDNTKRQKGEKTQMQNNVTHLWNKLQQLQTVHKQDIQNLKAEHQSKQIQSTDRYEVLYTQFRSLLQKVDAEQKTKRVHADLSSSVEGAQTEHARKLQGKIAVLEGANQALVQRCNRLQTIIASKSKIQQKLQSVKGERNELRQLVRQMNLQIHQLIRDQEIDISKLRRL